MSLTTSEMTPADIAALTGNRNNSGFGDGFGNGWWIILLFLFGFWGGGFNNGFGRNGGGSTGGAIDGYVLTSDFANIERKIDNVNNGLCDGFYAMNTSLLNGFASVNQNMSNGFQTAELSRANQQAALMQQLNAMQMQAANCCCETREAIQGVNYKLATQACETRNTLQNATRDIIDNQNSNSRAILDFLTTSKMQDLQAENQRLQLAASQQAQNSYLVSQLRPCPIPAYTVQNPFCCNQYQGCGCNG